MRIAFLGASGTGKSTLTQWISKEYSLDTNPIGSRSVAKMMGFDNPYDVDAAGKRTEFQIRLLLEKAKWEAEHETFVVDRTTLDVVSYICLHCISALTDEVLDNAFAWMKRYTHIYYCPLTAFINLDNDPNRVATMAYHKVYDTLIQGLIMKPGLRTRIVSLTMANLDDRKQILQEDLITL